MLRENLAESVKEPETRKKSENSALIVGRLRPVVYVKAKVSIFARMNIQSSNAETRSGIRSR